MPMWVNLVATIMLSCQHTMALLVWYPHKLAPGMMPKGSVKVEIGAAKKGVKVELRAR